jgi:hypothetical protein
MQTATPRSTHLTLLATEGSTKEGGEGSGEEANEAWDKTVATKSTETTTGAVQSRRGGGVSESGEDEKRQ